MLNLSQPKSLGNEVLWEVEVLWTVTFIVKYMDLPWSSLAETRLLPSPDSAGIRTVMPKDSSWESLMLSPTACDSRGSRL